MDSIKSRLSNHTRVCIVYRIFVVLINTIADVLTLLFDPKQRLHFKNQK